MSHPLPPPIPGTAVGVAPARRAIPPPPAPTTLSPNAAIGAIVVLTASLLTSKYLLDAVIRFRWPVAVYVALLAVVGYGPSLWWCRFVSRRWGTGDLGADIGLRARFADLGWGPVIWLGAIGAEIAIGAVVLAVGIPLTGNTEGMSEISADRTYVVVLVITAVVAAPVVEEMVFRGVVLRGLRSRLPVVAAVVAQGLLFGLAHVDPVRGVGNVGLVMVLSGVGVAFGIAATLLGRLGPSMVAHALFNGVVLLIVLTGVADRVQDASGGPGAFVARRQVAVVDQADLTEPGSDGEAGVSRLVGRPEPLDRSQTAAVEHDGIVEFGEWFVADHR